MSEKIPIQDSPSSWSGKPLSQEQAELIQRLTKDLPPTQTIEDWKRGRQAVETPQERIRRESETIAKSVSPERHKELDIQTAHSFEELYRKLRAGESMEGFNPEETVSRIEQVRRGASILLVPVRFGIQKRVDELLQIEKIRGGLIPPAGLETLIALNRRITALEMNASLNPLKYDQALRDARGEKERMILSSGRVLPDGGELLMQRANAYETYQRGVNEQLRIDQLTPLRQRVEELEYSILRKASAEKTRAGLGIKSGNQENYIFDETFRDSEERVVTAIKAELQEDEEKQAANPNTFDPIQFKKAVENTRRKLAIFERLQKSGHGSTSESDEQLFRSTQENPYPGADTVGGDMFDVLAVARREKPIAMIINHISNGEAFRHAEQIGLKRLVIPKGETGNSRVLIYPPEKEVDAVHLKNLLVHHKKEYNKEISRLLGNSV